MKNAKYVYHSYEISHWIDIYETGSLCQWRFLPIVVIMVIAKKKLLDNDQISSSGGVALGPDINPAS